MRDALQFKLYDPVLTFTRRKKAGMVFIAPNGKPIGLKPNDDIYALYSVGNAAFELLTLPNGGEAQTFWPLHDRWMMVAKVIRIFKRPKQRLGDPIDGYELLRTATGGTPRLRQTRVRILVFEALHDIDRALTRLHSGHDGATDAAIVAAQKVACASIITAGRQAAANLRRRWSRAGVAARRRQDPKARAKTEIREIWLSEGHLYPSKAAFSRAMLIKYRHILRNERVIVRWCRGWERERQRHSTS